MTKALRKTGKIIAMGIAALCAVIFALLITAQIVLILGINLFSTGGGSSFITRKVNESLSSTGYSITLDGVYYDPLRGVTVHDLAVADAQGSFLTLDHFSLKPSLILAPLRTLQIAANGGTLNLMRIPGGNAEENTAKDALSPFALPDIFFRRFALTNLSFDRVVLDEAVAGSPQSLQPRLRADVGYGRTIDLMLTFEPGMGDVAPHVPTPRTITVDAELNPATLAFTLRQFDINAAAYALAAAGAGDLGAAGNLHLTVQGEYDDLTALTNSSLKQGSIDATINGPLSGPGLRMTARLVPGTLKDRGLSEDITLTLETTDITQGMTGNATVKTALRGEPVTLAADLSYDAPLLRISDIKGTAPAVSLSGKGQFSTATTMFDGELAIQASDLSRYAALTGKNIKGTLNAQAQFKSADTIQSVTAKADITDAALDDIQVKSLSAQATIPDIRNPWPQEGRMNVTALRINQDITLDKLSAVIAAAGTDGTYRLTLDGNGRTPQVLGFDGTTLVTGIANKQPALRDLSLSLRHGNARLAVTGAAAMDAVDIKLSGVDIHGADIPAALPPQLANMRLDIDAALTGSPAQPQSTAKFILRGIAAGAHADSVITLTAAHEGETLSTRLSGTGTGIRKLDAAMTAPLAWAIYPFRLDLDKNAALSGTVDADIDLAALSPLLLPPGQSLAGSLTGNGTIAGTIASPAPAVDLRISEGTFIDDQNGITIAAITAAAGLTRDALTINSLTATDGGSGTLRAQGNAAFDGGASAITVTIKAFNIPRSTMANGIIDADMALRGSAQGMKVSGSAVINELNILIPESFSSKIPQLNIVEDEKESGPNFLERVALDVKITADNQVFVRGWGLDAEFGGDITVAGTAAAPNVTGAFTSRRGRYEEFGKRFTLARAELQFLGAVPPSPYLDIEATTPAGDVTGAVLLTGPVQAPSIKFSSTPALPEDEVLSRILFGKESARISPFQAVQLAQTLRRFSGQSTGPSIDPLGMIRSATGLDDISVETDDSGATSVGAGKYLTDKVYLGVSKGKGETSGEATIQIELLPSVNVESRIGQDAQGGGGIFWKRDY